MFYRFILIILLLAFAGQVGIFSQEKVKGGFKECIVYHYYIKDGKIDSSSKQKTEINKYDDNGNLIEFTYYLPENGSFWSKSIFKYDCNENILEQIGYYSNDSIKYIHRYKYDVNGNLIEEYEHDFEFDLMNHKRIYNYNSKGNISEIKDLEYDNQFLKLDHRIFNYNDDGYLIEMKDFDCDDSLKKLHVFNYDKKGNKINYSWFSIESLNGYDETYKYDEKNNIIEEIHYEYNSNPYRKITYKYNEKEQILEKETLQYKDSSTFKVINIYDEKGNKIKEYYDSNMFMPGFGFRRNIDDGILYKYDEFGNLTEKQYYEIKTNLFVYIYSK